MRPKLLIVEDERLIALDIKQRLVQLGYEVVAIANQADAALQAVTQHLPDLVLMDIHLQGAVDGIALAAKIQQQFNLPVIFLTAHADAATLTQAKATQPFGYLVKPVETHMLSTAIEIGLTRHQTEMAVQRALTKEKELNELKTRFISIVSHEFRNPLSAIKLIFDLLERQDPPVPLEQQQLYLQRGKTAVEHMNQLLEEVLIIGQAESGKLTYHPEPINVLWICRSLVEEFQTQLSAPQTIVFRYSGFDATGNPFYAMDVKLLRHILTNLLSNAIKYSPQGSDVYFDLAYTPEAISFRIQDQGIGIPADDQPRLFESFHRGANVKGIAGTGLGLSIVKQCVELHQGKIYIDSQVNQGTTVTVIFKPVPN